MLITVSTSLTIPCSWENIFPGLAQHTQLQLDTFLPARHLIPNSLAPFPPQCCWISPLRASPKPSQFMGSHRWPWLSVQETVGPGDTSGDMVFLYHLTLTERLEVFFSELFPWRALGVSTYQQNSMIKPRNTLYQLWVWWLVLSWTSFQKLQDWGCSHIPSWHIDINSENESFTESQENPYRNKWKMMSNSNKAADTNQLFFSLTYLKAALLV